MELFEVLVKIEDIEFEISEIEKEHERWGYSWDSEVQEGKKACEKKIKILEDRQIQLGILAALLRKEAK